VGGRWFIGGVAIAMVIVCLPLAAQRGRPLAPVPPGGQRVAPFFDGWYQNPDGTVSFSFGFSNLNRQELVEIPLGPDNVIEPKEFDGRQPTSFPPSGADAGEGGGGGNRERRDRERGVFTVTVPKGFSGDVVWTLRVRGQAYSVPANTKTTAYMLRWPRAMGSIPPLLRFKEGGPAGRGPMGIDSEPMKASVGTPLPLTIWITDDSVREPDPVAVRQRGAGKGVMNVTWFKHAGPGPVEFSQAKEPVQQLDSTAATTATFKQPGEYVIRVRADNFGRIDTSAGNQCCWTNGYIKVAVAP
jgi:hypothetical protein